METASIDFAGLEFIDEIDDMKIFRNRDGFLEGYKGKGKFVEGVGDINRNRQDIERIVSITTNVNDFMKFVRGRKPKTDKAITQQLKNQQAKLFM